MKKKLIDVSINIGQVVFLSCVLVLSGCASSNYPVTYDSIPRGAMLTCNGRNMGYTPLTLYYPRPTDKDYLDIAPCEALWPSGASTSGPNIVHFKLNPDGVLTTLQRPTNADGYETDSKFALEAESQRQQLAIENNRIQQNNINNMVNTLDQMGNSMRQAGEQAVHQSNSFTPPTVTPMGINPLNNNTVNCITTGMITTCR